MPEAKQQRATAARKPQRGDHTGQTAITLRAEKDAAEAILREEEAREYEAIKVRRDTVVDVSGGDPVVLAIVEESSPDGEPVPDENGLVRARIAFPVEQMTYGRKIERQSMTDEYGEPVIGRNGKEVIVETPGSIRYIDFEEGRLYQMDLDMYRHLNSRGLIAH